MKYLKQVLILGLILNFEAFKAQSSCTLCTVSFSNTNSNSYTITTGETFCILNGGRFTGSIVLNGGTICSEGLFTPVNFTFNSGIINNYSSMILNGDLALGTTKQFNNEKKSILRLKGSLIINGGLYKNMGINNIQLDLNFMSGSLLNEGIINCRQFSGSSVQITNTGIINKD